MAEGPSGHGHCYVCHPGDGVYPPSSDGDSSVLPGLLEQIPGNEEIGTVTADGAYDTRICHTAIIDRQTAQIQLRIALINRFSVLGTA